MLNKLRSDRKTKQLFEEFAERADLVYFGSVDMHEAEEPILGITFAARHQDDHYIHGNYQGYETSFLHRRTTLSAPGQNAAEFEWTLVRLKLDIQGLPHLFIDAHHYDQLLYANIFAKFGHLKVLNKSLEPTNVSFSEAFLVFGEPRMNALVGSYLPDHVMQRMLTNFRKFDVEVTDSYLFIYLYGAPDNQKILTSMLSEAVWLAETTERNHSLLEEPQD